MGSRSERLGEVGAEAGADCNGDAGRPVRFATVETSLGWVLVAMTDRGICRIEVGDSPDPLEGRLRDRFPGAELAGDDAGFADRLRMVVAMVDRPGERVDPPLDVRGTAFQVRVWEALRAIPAGSTATYADVARAIGRPSAVRAVARAIGSNELAVAIPCHRVVRTDGGLGGYRWGVDRKRALLGAESGSEGTNESSNGQ